MNQLPLPSSFAGSDHSVLDKSALAQARAIAQGELTSEELVLTYLTRIARFDKSLGAFVSVQGERALREARAKDRELAAARRRGHRLPPFFGVPTAVKDLHLLRGAPAKMGSRAFSWLYSPIDDLTVRALRRGGFVILGKTATSELALLPIVETDLHPPTRNPWNPACTAGGSSGGAAAAVSAGLIPVSPGSDGAGSVRIPAALCGLVGYKPSRDAIPNPHARYDYAKMTAIGTLARCVDDGVALADVLCGRDPEIAVSLLHTVQTPPRPLRVAIMTHPALDCAVDPQLVDATRSAAQALAEKGHTIVAELPRITVTLEQFLPIYQRLFARMPVPFESRLQPMTRWFRTEGRRFTDAQAQDALESLRGLISNVKLVGEVDLIISPTTAVLPPPVGAFAHLPPAEMFRAVAPLGAFTAPWNITGQPAVTVPWTRSSDGMPIGVQLIGRVGEDALVLATARQLEACRPA